MSSYPPQFHYPNVLGQQPNAIYRFGEKEEGRSITKPGGFRIPLIYFSWGLLQGKRTLHHHPDNDELLLILEGEATVRLYGPGKPDMRQLETYEVSAGDVVLFPQGWTHSVDEKGPENSLKVLAIFNNQDFKANEDGNQFILPEPGANWHLGENS